jgi:4-hydroxy-3-methylbut-2-enyl diphosphate reductase
VVGAQNSSNSNRLREVGALQGIQSYLIQDETDLKQEWFQKQVKVGVTAGASAPEILVNRVLEQLKVWGVTQIETMDGEEETTVFKIPAELL